MVVVVECFAWCFVGVFYVVDADDDLSVGVVFFEVEDLWDSVCGGCGVVGCWSPVGFACPECVEACHLLGVVDDVGCELFVVVNVGGVGDECECYPQGMDHLFSFFFIRVIWGFWVKWVSSPPEMGFTLPPVMGFTPKCQLSTRHVQW